MDENQKLIYSTINHAICREVSANFLNILDVGCGAGDLGEYLKSKNQKRIVHGITYSQEEYELSSKKLDKVVIRDLNNADPLHGLPEYDCIICSHVLEHLYEPAKLLKVLKEHLSLKGVVIIALPNILFFKQRLKLFLGHFEYSEEGGLMDITHFRFFDWDTALRMVKDSGFDIISRRADGYFPLPLLRKVKPLARLLDNWAIKAFPGLFGVQFIIVAG